MANNWMRNGKGPYLRRRESAFFDLLRRDSKLMDQNLSGDPDGTGEMKPKKASGHKPESISASNPVLETYIHSLREGQYKTSLPSQFLLPPNLGPWEINSNQKDISSQSLSKSNTWAGEVGENGLEKMDKVDNSMDGFAKVIDANKEFQHVNKKKPKPTKSALPQSAASYYSGVKVQVEVLALCDGVNELNKYLKDGRARLEAGVPGKYLHVVIEPLLSGVGPIISTIMYAFYLSTTKDDNQLCTMPVINMKREDLALCNELVWLLDSCRIDKSSLIFIDEIDLSYYDLYGSLKLVLVNGHELPTSLENLKESVVEIFNRKQDDSLYPWVETVTVVEGVSCCSVVAEKFALTAPEILAGRGFSRFLLAGILLDTENLTNAQCSSNDKYMATLLINGAGRFGCNGLYMILTYKLFDTPEIKVRDILCKDYKRWAGRTAGKSESGSELDISHIGMSSIGVSLGYLLSLEESALEEVIRFRKSEDLRLLVIVTGYYDDQKKFKRELLLSSVTKELMMSLLEFLELNASRLPLKILDRPGFMDYVRAFEIKNKVTSRTTIERLLEEFAVSLRHGGHDYNEFV
ncbi:hypothetical protein AMTR_s00092p00130570 [Amborella trichopoda]|uniref:DHHA2 domain-containing protein n=1 Tax=Amborella trichopoda TaxID=13333 RepID=W1NX40_AMBTC|nr:hypothetical protein AMTR_s00092p00130570 [Amborella trichopoda]